MIIRADITIVNGHKASISPSLKLFRGDSVFIEFSLYNSIISSINDIDVEDKMPLSQLQNVKLKLVTPNGTPTLENTEIIDNRAKFKIQEEHTSETGTYKFQLICYDSDGCKFHIPALTYVIAEPIGELI